MKKFFGFGSSTPPPPAPPAKPPTLAPKPAPAAAFPKPATSTAASVTAPAPSLVGRWKDSAGGQDTTEFHADGSVTEKGASGETIRGRYVFAGGKLKINLEGVLDELSFTGSVGAETLELADKDGQITLYRRIE